MFSNFIFDNKSNKLFGLICVKFDSASGASTYSGGCETELVTEKTPRSSEFHILKQTYTAPLQFTFQVCNVDGTPITPQLEQSIKKWLCQRGVYKPFQIDADGFGSIYYNVNISNPRLVSIGNTVGMEFTVIANAPFGYSPIMKKQFTITSTNKVIRLLIDNYDDYVYPTVTIEMTESGSLTISNSTEVNGKIFQLDNLVFGEVIKVESKLPYISSSIASHNAFQDFNNNWIRFVDGLNTLTFNLNCKVTIEYRERREVGVYS